MAETLLDVAQPLRWVGSVQHTLYEAMRARGAMPEILPRLTPLMMALVPPLPAAVVDVWLPWPPSPTEPPIESRGEANSVQCSCWLAVL